MICDTLLVNPNNRIISPFAGVEPPLWAGLIASDLIRQGKKVAILDAEAEDLSVEETIRRIHMASARKTIFVVMGNNPSVSSTPKMAVTKRLVDILLGDRQMAVTGLHPSALPKQTKAELGIEVLRGKIFQGTPDMPWDLLPMDRYIAHNWHTLHDGGSRKPYASIYTSLNCPFQCAYCNIHALYGNTRRVWYRDVDAVVREIDILVKKYGVKNIKIWDELFTLNKERVNLICDKLIERGYDLNIWAYARVDTVEPKMLAKLRKAGVNWLAFGFESGSDLVLGEVNKKANRAQAVKAVEMTHDVGINVGANFIFGLEGDNLGTMRETLDFAKSLGVEWGNFYFQEILPGSPLWDKTPEKDKDWARFGQFSPTPRDDEAIRFRDKAFVEFFTDSKYLDNIRKKFGEQAVGQINDMLRFGKPKTRVVGE